LEGFSDGPHVRVDEALVGADHGHDRHRLRCRNGEVVKTPSVGLRGSVGGEAVGALALAQELAVGRIEPFA
jgi:hypothetical protein